MIFDNVFKQSFYTLLNISGLLVNLPENIESAKSRKSMKEFFGNNIKKIQSFWETTGILKICYHCILRLSSNFWIIYKPSWYLEPIRSMKKPMSGLSGKLVGNSDFFRQTMNKFSIMKMQIGFLFTLFKYSIVCLKVFHMRNIFKLSGSLYFNQR